MSVSSFLDLFYDSDLPFGFQVYASIVIVCFFLAFVQSGIRGDLLDLDANLAFYKSYHSDPVNIFIHACCIWPILWTSLYIFSFTFPICVLPSVVAQYLPSFIECDACLIIAFIYALFYVFMDKKGKGIVGWMAGLLVLVCGVTAQAAYEGQFAPKGTFMKYALIWHVCAWVAQFWGHGVHERRAPALFTNLAQALLMAPLFVFLEASFLVGVYPELKAKVEAITAKNIAGFKKGKNEKAN